MSAFVLSILLLAQTPKHDAQPKPPVYVADLMFIEDMLTNRCRGGASDDPDTQKACVVGYRVFHAIEAEGWCWGHVGQVDADKGWEPCPVRKK